MDDDRARPAQRPDAREPRAPLRVVLDARLRDGAHGGIQQTVIGLAVGLAVLGGDDQYLFLCGESSDWLAPYLRGPCRMLKGAGFARRGAPLSRAAGRLLRAGWMRRALESAPLASLVPVSIAPSDGTVERAGADVVHFTFQDGFLTSVPSLYNPHDLQHLHHPEFFSRLGMRWREVYYRGLARQARAVIALSEWGRRDVVEGLSVPPEKVHVIGWAPPVDAYDAPSAEEIAAARAALRLPDAFALYPAQTFPHKNHLGLAEALARVRRRSGLRVVVVCPGTRTDHHAAIARRARALDVEDQLRFVGFLGPRELSALYRLARFLVFPSEFEGFGMPVVEAFRLRLPVACSTASALPEVAGDAALMFDPGDPDAIGEAMARLWTDEALRGDLVERGARRVAPMSWVEVARRYRAIYRFVAGRWLGAEDAALLRRPDLPAGAAPTVGGGSPGAGSPRAAPEPAR